MVYYADTYSCKVHAIPCNAAGIPSGNTQKWRTVLTLDKELEGMPGEAVCITDHDVAQGFPRTLHSRALLRVCTRLPPRALIYMRMRRISPSTPHRCCRWNRNRRSGQCVGGA